MASAMTLDGQQEPLGSFCRPCRSQSVCTLKLLGCWSGKGLSKEAMKKLLERHEELTDYAFELEAEQRKKRDGIGRLGWAEET